MVIHLWHTHIGINLLLFFVQANTGCRLHDFHDGTADLSSSLPLEGKVKLVKKACSNTRLLLHQGLGYVGVKGDPQ